MFDEVSRPYRDSLDHTWKSAGGDSKLSLHDTFYIYIHTHTHTHTYVLMEIKGLPRWLYW